MRTHIVAQDSTSYARLLAALKDRKKEPVPVNPERFLVACELDKKEINSLKEEGYEVNYERLRISTSEIESCPPKSFAARMERDDELLLVPQDLGKFASQYGIRNAEELLSYLWSFPTAFTTLLNWSYEDLQEATTELVNQVCGKVRDEFLSPPKPQKREYISPPPQLSWQIGKSAAAISFVNTVNRCFWSIGFLTKLDQGEIDTEELIIPPDATQEQIDEIIKQYAQNARSFIASNMPSEFGLEDIGILGDVVEKVTEGKLDFTEFVTPKQYLEKIKLGASQN